jgi:hypothetical protein
MPRGIEEEQTAKQRVHGVGHRGLVLQLLELLPYPNGAPEMGRHGTPAREEICIRNRAFSRRDTKLDDETKARSSPLLHPGQV